MNIEKVQQYVDMQKRQYVEEINKWSIHNRDPVVGTFNKHNDWPEYEHLFKDVVDLQDMTVLDFGCGPGRNLVKYASRCKRIDGVDLVKESLDKAKEWIIDNKLNLNNFSLYTCNGYDLENIPSDSYDLVISTICLQHICVWEIRQNLFKEFFRVLQPNGQLSFQMAFNKNNLRKDEYRGYYDNFYEAINTNGGCDVSVTNPNQLTLDLSEIGFTFFNYYLTLPGPGDTTENWIFLNCRKLQEKNN